MTALLARLRSWFGRSRSTVLPRAGIRVNVPRSVMHRLRVATRPTATNREPLAFLLVRYASEEVRDVVVAFAVLPFADEAYVDGDAGANFDTRWSMSVANEEIRRNAACCRHIYMAGQGVRLSATWIRRRTFMSWRRSPMASRWHPTARSSSATTTRWPSSPSRGACEARGSWLSPIGSAIWMHHD